MIIVNLYNRYIDIVEKKMIIRDEKKTDSLLKNEIQMYRRKREAFMSFLDVDCQFYRNCACKFDLVMSSVLTV